MHREASIPQLFEIHSSNYYQNAGNLIRRRELAAANSSKDSAACTDVSTQTEELCVDNLLQGLKEMLLSSKHSDFVVNVKKEFKVHKIILAAHSPVFAAMIEHDTKEKATGSVDIDDCEPITFSNFLDFLYTGKVEKLTLDTALDLYRVADKYQVPELNNLCMKYIMNNISIDSFCEVLTLGLRYQAKELIEEATQFFLRNSKEIAVTAKWGLFLNENPVAGNELFLKALNFKTP